MFDSILKSRVDFFESTPIGRILNRFNSDISIVENDAPQSLQKFLSYFFQISITIVIVSVATPYFLVGFLPILLIYMYIRKYFVVSLRQLKRLDSASKSPIYSYFNETLIGLSTVRAYKAEDKFLRNMRTNIDKNLMFYFPTNIANRWLALRLDLLKNLIVTIASLLAILERDRINTGIAVLSITYCLNVSSL